MTPAQALAAARERFGADAWIERLKHNRIVHCSRHGKLPLVGSAGGTLGPLRRCCDSAQRFAAYYNANPCEAGATYTIPGLGTGRRVEFNAPTWREGFAKWDERRERDRAEGERIREIHRARLGNLQRARAAKAAKRTAATSRASIRPGPHSWDTDI